MAFQLHIAPGKMRYSAHARDSDIEKYAWSRLRGGAKSALEEHLLECGACRMKVTIEDNTRENFLRGLIPRRADPVGDRALELAGTIRQVPKVLHFKTHLPVYSLDIAAGSFGPQQSTVRPVGWVEVTPSPTRVTRDMFVARITGRSMEPMIPDRALCAFRSDVAAPYHGKILLLEDYGESGGNRYSVKRYLKSVHADPDEEGGPAWLHERITLESVNPDFKPIEIPSACKVNVIGEFAFTI